jgi:hypothetical protein
MREVLSVAQLEALAGDGQDWLYQFLAVLHVGHTVVLTLNYDNLLECGLSGRWLTVPGQVVEFVEEDDVLDGLPPLARALEPLPSATFGNVFAEPVRLYGRLPVETFRLLKLHGSLSWYWVLGDASGVTLQRWQLPGGFGAPLEADEAARARALPRRQSFIVPPTALKSEHLRSPLIGELWQRAAKALATAKRIALLGYSLPPADRSFSEMLANAVRGRDAVLDVVNRHASKVILDDRRSVGTGRG